MAGMGDILMLSDSRILNDALSLALETYVDMRQRSEAQISAAESELRHYLPQLIAQGEIDRTRLAVRGLTHLRELENRPPPLPVWMRRRLEIMKLAEAKSDIASAS